MIRILVPRLVMIAVHDFWSIVPITAHLDSPSDCTGTSRTEKNKARQTRGRDGCTWRREGVDVESRRRRCAYGGSSSERNFRGAIFISAGRVTPEALDEWDSSGWASPGRGDSN